ncbi:unnamed protein product [Cercopithifilaria johnstoni]|uniref:Uncharacterized protein n=1 Tax=Cercopithifilaria johnstoni TaxID=2874296 RepID=A0A8J2Q8Q5_9BILA|nr:unnamed protein product [Cercopithifilaria johnstoni]
MHKQGILENGEKRTENGVFNNFMVERQIPLAISSSMLPIYKRTEFMVLSAGVVVYWILMVFIGAILIMCCICTKFRANEDDEDEITQKKKGKK